MSLAGLHDARAKGQAAADTDTINDVLAGNLCRAPAMGPSSQRQERLHEAGSAGHPCRPTPKARCKRQDDGTYLDLHGSKPIRRAQTLKPVAGPK